MVILGGLGVSYERGTPVIPRRVPRTMQRFVVGLSMIHDDVDPRQALRGGISKVNSWQVCHLLTAVPLKMAPKPSPNPKTVPWDTPT